MSDNKLQELQEKFKKLERKTDRVQSILAKLIAYSDRSLGTDLQQVLMDELYEDLG